MQVLHTPSVLMAAHFSLFLLSFELNLSAHEQYVCSLGLQVYGFVVVWVPSRVFLIVQQLNSCGNYVMSTSHQVATLVMRKEERSFNY